jgi:hypothetical protein
MARILTGNTSVYRSETGDSHVAVAFATAATKRIPLIFSTERERSRRREAPLDTGAEAALGTGCGWIPIERVALHLCASALAMDICVATIREAD